MTPARSGMDDDMEYKGYQGRYEWDDELQAFYGEVVNIGGDVVTFQGATVAEAEQAFRNSVDDYLAFVKSTS